MKANLLGQEVTVVMEHYADGNKRLQAYYEDKDMGGMEMPWATLTINKPKELTSQEVCIKDYSENSGYYQALIESEVIKVAHRYNGADPVCYMTDKMIASVLGEDLKECPHCGKEAILDSLSRKDNETMICSSCGQNEALGVYFGSLEYYLFACNPDRKEITDVVLNESKGYSLEQLLKEFYSCQESREFSYIALGVTYYPPTGLPPAYDLVTWKAGMEVGSVTKNVTKHVEAQNFINEQQSKHDLRELKLALLADLNANRV